MKPNLLAPLSLVVLAACVADTGTAVEEVVQRTIAAGATTEVVYVVEAAGPVVVTVDCAPPKNPDQKGALLSISAAELGTTDMPVRAGYWQWAGELGAGEHKISLKNVGSAKATCKIGHKPQVVESEEACTAWTAHRSPITHASHIAVGDTTSGEWEALPASGNHWGAWAPWFTAYGRPVLRGFYLHNLEHGGLVLSYGCESSDESEACKAAEQQLIDLALELGQQRLIVTPDPNQKTMFALRSWRWAYSSDCLDQASALEFLTQHYRRGREDIDADPPISFDPTVETDVPCENLMAAPDGC